jgi:hypothetical protein
LVRQLIEARDARELTRLQQRVLRVDVQSSTSSGLSSSTASAASCSSI